MRSFALVTIALLVTSGCAGNEIEDAVGTGDRTTPSTKPTTSSPPFARCTEEAAVRADHPGTVPTEATPIVGGVQLPAGGAKTPDPTYLSRGRTAPAVWVTDGAADVSLWRDLVEVFPETGLWPVFASSLGLGTDGSRPWDAGEFDPDDVTRIDAVDVPSAFETFWTEGVASPEFPELTEPYATDPPPMAVRDDTCTARLADLASEGAPERLALIPAARPADAITALGWTGPANYTYEMAPMSAILRSWEDRFGAYVIGIGFDVLTVGFERMPTDESNRLSLAAEMTAFCPDLVFQGTESVRALADELGRTSTVQFWWD